MRVGEELGGGPETTTYWECKLTGYRVRDEMQGEFLRGQAFFSTFNNWCFLLMLWCVSFPLPIRLDSAGLSEKSKVRCVALMGGGKVTDAGTWVRMYSRFSEWCLYTDTYIMYGGISCCDLLAAKTDSHSLWSSPRQRFVARFLSFSGDRQARTKARMGKTNPTGKIITCLGTTGEP